MDHNNPSPEKGSPLRPDPETLHSTDPQKHMDGPLSSLMHSIGKEGEKSDHDEPVPPGGEGQPQDADK